MCINCIIFKTTKYIFIEWNLYIWKKSSNFAAQSCKGNN